ncbi:hypothetical protein MG293_017786 [Ovis ammon polii]|uniref:Uncharacterized protein n=1 Tax=Ovis ammon polii TaxID=230172 RepID=A0AAD4TSI0_OVIAM|nr:hypothetical protein MG293_017786 [Ovis ammon polii]
MMFLLRAGEDLQGLFAVAADVIASITADENLPKVTCGKQPQPCSKPIHPGSFLAVVSEAVFHSLNDTGRSTLALSSPSISAGFILRSLLSACKVLGDRAENRGLWVPSTLLVDMQPCETTFSTHQEVPISGPLPMAVASAKSTFPYPLLSWTHLYHARSCSDASNMSPAPWPG